MTDIVKTPTLALLKERFPVGPMALPETFAAQMHAISQMVELFTTMSDGITKDDAGFSFTAASGTIADKQRPLLEKLSAEEDPDEAEVRKVMRANKLEAITEFTPENLRKFLAWDHFSDIGSRVISTFGQVGPMLAMQVGPVQLAIHVTNLMISSATHAIIEKFLLDMNPDLSFPLTEYVVWRVKANLEGADLHIIDYLIDDEGNFCPDALQTAIDNDK